MKDLAIALENRPGAFAKMAEVLNRAGGGGEGGGVWTVNGVGVAHFLFADATAARNALEAAGIRVIAEREVLVEPLRRGRPGQLGLLARRMGEAGVNIETLYLGGDHRLILVVDDPARGRDVIRSWNRETQKSIRLRSTGE